MNSRLFLGLALLPLASIASGASYITDFNSFGPAGSDVNGQFGWSINDTTDQYSQIANSNVNVFAPSNVSKVLNLGNASAVDTPPIGSSVVLSHGYSGNIGSTSLSFAFVLIDSITDSSNAFENRDQFGVSFTTGGSDILSVMFVPTTQSGDPSADEAKWDLYYKVGNGPSVALNLGVFEFAQYFFDLKLTPNGSTTDLNLTLTGGLNSLSDSATGLAIDPNAATTDFNLIWAKDQPSGFGSNQILVDNLSIVPEPSTPLLGLIGVGLLLRTRRRN